jgi:excisionase family DNA binding protein
MVTPAISLIDTEALRDFIRQVVREETAGVRAANEIEPDRFLTVKEAARLSSHPEDTIRKWLQRGTLRNYGRHRAPRVRLGDILNLNQ